MSAASIQVIARIPKARAEQLSENYWEINEHDGNFHATWGTGKTEEEAWENARTNIELNP